jgi:hypothetical protein
MALGTFAQSLLAVLLGISILHRMDSPRTYARMESNRLPIRLHTSCHSADGAVEVASCQRFKNVIRTNDLEAISFMLIEHLNAHPNGGPQMLSLELASPPVRNRGRPSSREFR